jgi:hypothetical protein
MPTFNGFSFQLPGPPRAGQVIPQLSPEALAATGPIIQVQIQAPQVLAQALQKAAAPLPPRVQGFALVDTGASISSADTSVLTQLGISQNGVALVGTAGGQQQQFTYAARLSFPGTAIPGFDRPKMLGCDLVGHMVFGIPNARIIALIGRDILRLFAFVYNGSAGAWSLSI